MSIGGRWRWAPWRGLPFLGGLAGIALLTLAAVGLMNGHGDEASPVAAAPATFGPATATAEAVTGAPTRAPAAAHRPLGSPPGQLSLPTLNVQAPVEQEVTTKGVLGVPDDPAHVGWWTGSARPGALVGSVVLDGHVDSATRGLGALHQLTTLRSGDPVIVRAVDGTRWRYRVYARQSYSKQQPLPANLFTRTGPDRLVMITCGGAFDASTRHYEANVVVLASLQQDSG